MSNLGKIMAIASMMAAVSESHFDVGRKTFLPKNTEPEWKRKKCKSCRKCGDNCYTYDYKGRILVKFSKPNYNACESYSKRKK